MLTARHKLCSILDKDSFIEHNAKLHAKNPLDFLGYDKKLELSRKVSGEVEAVITGTGLIYGIAGMFIIFEPLFLLGSMGLAVGEKTTKAFDYATKKKLPVISISASGGARMQEGIFSLVQMAKTSGAVYQHNKKGLLYISVISDPTLGGVTASFASLGDIIVGEKSARFGFTGKRIIEETTHETLPDDFQTVEYAKNHGMLDIIVEKDELRDLLGRLLKMHLN